MAENLILNANNEALNGQVFSTIRMGNILGSRGSVLPLFEEQKNTGELTITDEEMTRFFITPKQAAKQVLSSIEIMQGGEIFVPKLKSAKIINLAKETAPNCKLKIIGALKEEKLHEDLITNEELPKTYELQDRYVILPSKNKFTEAKKISDDFSISSADKDIELTAQELKEMIADSLTN